MEKLPKYIQNANLVLETLIEEPGQVWTQTQRELGARLNLPQPILSGALSLLEQQGRIRRENPLPFRGKSFEIELINATPLDAPVARKTAQVDALKQENEELRNELLQLRRSKLEAIVQTTPANPRPVASEWEDPQGTLYFGAN